MNSTTRALVRREREAQRQLVAAYGRAIGQVQRELQVLLYDIAQARLRGEPVSGTWLRRQADYERWLQLTRQELATYVLHAEQILRDLQAGHISQAIDDTHRQIRAGLGQAPPATVAAVTAEFKVPPAQVVANMIGRASDGTPLAGLLADAAGAAHDAARETLVTGVIRGHGPRQIARDLHRTTGIGLNRSLLIARTESIGAYRQTALDTYRANQNVVQAWVWTASLDTRTCPACWAMDGTIHALDESLNSHPGCRCTPTPRTMSWRDMGIDLPDNRPPVITGPERFARLSDPEQLAVLGPGKYQAFKDGQITLTDLVQPTHSARWGPGMREATLESALTKG